MLLVLNMYYVSLLNTINLWQVIDYWRIVSARRRKKITFLDFICLVETVLWKISKKVIQMEIYHSRRLNENSQILPGQND